MLSSLAFMTLLFQAPAAAPSSPLQVAYFDTCALQSGERILDCYLTYRWYGEPRPDGSNVIVVPTWLIGTAENVASLVGDDRLLDAKNYALLAIDAFANGVSSSPSTSLRQRHSAFPQVSLEDMVVWQHALVANTLGFKHVKAVLGMSMGGMQALQWAVSFPDFMDKVVSLVGSPKPALADMTPWRLQLASYRAAAALGYYSGADAAYQVAAMMTHDIAHGAPFASLVPKIHAQVFMVLNKQDMLLRPGSSMELAALLHNEVLLFDEPCGHFSAALCKREQTQAALAIFLRR